MINALVSLNADLASSIAFRYSCLLTGVADIRLQPIHVEQVDKNGYPPGSGWVRSTWEKGLLHTATEEISQLLYAERSSCPPLDTTIVRIGDREEELLKELEEHAYEILLEGVLNSFDSRLFKQKVHSKLFKEAPCPIILVKNLVNPDRMALLLGDPKDVKPLVSCFLRLFGKSRVTVDLVYYIVKKTGQPEFRKKAADSAGPDWEKAVRVIDEAKVLLAEDGWTPEESWIIQDSIKRIGDMMGEYGLVGAYTPRSTSRKQQIMDLLSRVPSATLSCKW
ncbi:MAG: hypothetical protein KKB20_16765 [Proteobacteria bacterium]|nr:hypothetical protein [Pseudomonadota bacterium]